MLNVQRFVNELMDSNCYVVYDEETKRCLVFDPASEKSLQEIQFVGEKGLNLDYILLTHEHTDHTWGVNSILEHYPFAKVICSGLCKDALSREARMYFLLYYDDMNYKYSVKRVDYTTEELGWHLDWLGHDIKFVPTPGHSPGSVCISIDNCMVFGGDTLMPFKPFIKKRNGGSVVLFHESVKKMINSYPEDIVVYPGHGESCELGDIIKILKYYE